MEKNSCPPAGNYKMLPKSLSEKMYKLFILQIKLNFYQYHC